MNKALLSLAVLALLTGYAQAEDAAPGTIAVETPWARATPAGAEVAGGYVTIRNRGTAPDTLVGGSLDAAAHAEVHAMTMDGGVMRMRPAGPVTVPPGGALTLSPAGLHLMFTGLKRPLKVGDTVDGTLVFAHAGTVPVHFHVEGIGAKGPTGDAAAMPGMEMSR